MNCSKCGEKHYPPSGRNCQQLSADDFIVVTSRKGKKRDTRLSTVTGHSGSPSGNPTVDSEMDLPVNEDGVRQHADQVDTASGGPSTSDAQATGIQQILQELQKVNQRLDAVESRTVQDRDSSRTPTKNSKLSSNQRYFKSKTFGRSRCNELSDVDSESYDEEVDFPSLHTLRTSKTIQSRVDRSLAALGKDSDARGNDNQKIKSKRGGVDVVVSQKVAWPHEHILGGANRSRLTYDQLNLTQFVQGFVKNVLDEQNQDCREKMLTYLCDLMEDANDFMQCYCVKWKGGLFPGMIVTGLTG